MYRTSSLLLVALSLPFASVAAQELVRSRFDDALLTAPPAIERVEPAPAAPAAPAAPGAAAESAAAPESADTNSGFSWRALAHAVGGAVVGGWVGYVGSQVIKDDWEKDSNGSFRSHRSLLAAAGALVGVVGSRLIGPTESPVGGLSPDRPEREDRKLTGKEIAESDTRNAYELISTLRQHWLVVRGLHSHTEAAKGFGEGAVFRVQPGAEKILVYMDDIRLGGVSALRDVSTDVLTSARFLDARQATYRYGSGHTHGAILLSTEVRAP